MEKSYVTLALCPICKEETGELLMDRRLKPTFEMHTIVPHSVCEKCREKYLKEAVLLINPKTGSLVVIKDEAFKGMFNKDIPPQRIAFCDEEVLEKINKAYAEHTN